MSHNWSKDQLLSKKSIVTVYRFSAHNLQLKTLKSSPEDIFLSDCGFHALKIWITFAKFRSDKAAYLQKLGHVYFSKELYQIFPFRQLEWKNWNSDLKSLRCLDEQIKWIAAVGVAVVAGAADVHAALE